MTQQAARTSDASDWINPVAVKEMRQAVQSRWVVAVLVLFLLLNLAVVGGYLLLSPEIQTDTEAGQGVFTVLLGILMFICFTFVPAYTGLRLSLERHSTDIDLFFVTTITPGAIVRGKYVTAMAITLLIFSACMPFMVLTYLLRGIDLPTIFTVLVACFILCAAANALGLFAGAVSGGWIIRGLVAAGIGLFLFYMSMVVGPGIYWLLFFGGGSLLDIGRETWALIGTYLVIEALGIGMLYVFSVALLTPRSANRMMTPRLYLTGCWVTSGCLAILWSYYSGTLEPVTGWTVLSTMVLSLLLVAALGERDTWSPRVRKTIPRNTLARMAAFLLYTGSAGGMLWYSMLLGATLLAANGWGQAMASYSGGSELIEVFPGSMMGFGYILCYCLTIASLRPLLFPQVPTPHLSVFAMVLGVAMCLVPYLVAFFLDHHWWSTLPWYMLGSPLVLTEMNAPLRASALQALSIWLVVAGLGSIPWLLGQVRRFSPYRADSEPELASASAAA